ncbi:MAG: AAA family ATPase, partial [Acidobacteriota bacterium]
MRISRLSMEGFGLFQDADVRDLPPGLSLFLGDNEAGKSTTLGFVHTVLFGYSDGRRHQNAYPALRGGQPGGRMELETEAFGRVILERRPGKKGGRVSVTFSDGRSGGQEALDRLLAGTTQPLYRNVYAFSLTELQTMETLTSTEVKEVIYGASLGASARSLPQARKYLEARMEELFRPSGRKPEINALLKDLGMVRSKLCEAGGRIKEYESLALELARLEKLIGELQKQRESEREAHERCKAQVALWDDWMAFLNAEEGLLRLPEAVKTFPEDGLIKLDDLAGKRKSQMEELRRAQDDLEEKRGRLEQTAFDSSLLAKEAEIRDLLQGLGTWEKSTGEIARIGEKLKSLRRKTASDLAQFGAGWTEKQVLALDRSPMSRREIEEHRLALDRARRLLDRATDAQQERRATAEDMAQEEEEARKKVESLQDHRLEIDPETLAALHKGCDGFKNVLRDIPKVELKHTEAAGRLQGLLQEINPEWRLRTLMEFDVSLTSHQRLEDMDRRLDEARQQEREAAGHLARADKTLEETGEAVARKARQIEAAGKDISSLPALEQRGRLIRSLRSAFSQREQVKGALEAVRRAVHSHRPLPAGGPEGLLARRLRMLAGTAAALALPAGLALWLAFDPRAGGMASGFLFTMAAVLFLMGRPVSGAAREQHGTAALDPEDDGGIRRMEIRLQSLDKEMKVLMEKLDLDGELDATGIDRLDEANRGRMLEAQQLDNLKIGLHELQENRNRAAKEKEAALTRLEASKRRLETAEAACRSLIAALKLPSGTSLRTAGLVFGKVGTAREQAQAMDELKARLAEMRQTRDRYLHLMRGVPGLEQAVQAAGGEDQIAALTAFLDRMDRQAQAERLLGEARAAAENASRQRAAAQEKLEAAACDRRKAAAAEQKAVQSWAGWLRRHRMSENWPPETCLELLEQAGRLADLAGMRTEAEEERRQLSHAETLYRERILALCRDLGREEPPADKLAVEIHLLDSALRENLARRTRHQDLSGEIQRLESNLLQRRKSIQDLEASIRRLLRAGGASDEETFRRRGRLFARRRDLMEAMERHAGNARKISGHSDIEALRKDLEGATLPMLKAAQAGSESRIQETQRRLEELQQEHARTDERRKQLHDENAVAQLRAEEESLLERLREKMGDWSRHAVARHLLFTAKDRFEKAHQPEVIRQASGYFSRITGGRYTQVFVPHDGDEDMAVIDHRGDRKKVEVLSRGTSEQLYLAIRFGYIARHGARRGVATPVN